MFLISHELDVSELTFEDFKTIHLACWVLILVHCREVSSMEIEHKTLFQLFALSYTNPLVCCYISKVDILVIQLRWITENFPFQGNFKTSFQFYQGLRIQTRVNTYVIYFSALLWATNTNQYCCLHGILLEENGNQMLYYVSHVSCVLLRVAEGPLTSCIFALTG